MTCSSENKKNRVPAVLAGFEIELYNAYNFLIIIHKRNISTLTEQKVYHGHYNKQMVSKHIDRWPCSQIND
jgi:hypothetical protein